MYSTRTTTVTVSYTDTLTKGGRGESGSTCTVHLCGGVCGWNNDKGLCSKFVHINCVDRVVDGPHGW